MDILAHALWTGAGLVALHRKTALPRSVVLASLAMSVVPDLLHNLPLLAWVVGGDGTLAQAAAYATATPATEPALPGWVWAWAHHLHCTFHSLLVVGGVALASWRWRRSRRWRHWLVLPLSAWCLHIVVDVFTHSSTYYPVPLFYPITQRGFGLIAWNTPWFEAINYLALALVAAGLWLTRRKPVREA